MNQKEAVYQAVLAVLGTVDGKVLEYISKSQLEHIHSILVDWFIEGKVQLRGDRTPEWIRKYVPGLVNNWLRKDERLNGGERYVTKNPGSRTGSGDEQLKALKALLAVTTDPSARVEIQRAIDKRIEELKPKTEINISALPEHLRHLVPGA